MSRFFNCFRFLVCSLHHCEGHRQEFISLTSTYVPQVTVILDTSTTNHLFITLAPRTSHIAPSKRDRGSVTSLSLLAVAVYYTK